MPSCAIMRALLACDFFVTATRRSVLYIFVVLEVDTPDPALERDRSSDGGSGPSSSCGWWCRAISHDMSSMTTKPSDDGFDRPRLARGVRHP